MRISVNTPNLGDVTITNNVIEYFSKHRTDGDLRKAAEDVTQILQSQEIEQLGIPTPVANRLSSNGGDPNAIEFWVHIGSSMLFTVLPKDGYKVVCMAMKQDVKELVSD